MIFATMRFEPKQPFYVSRAAGAVASARPEPAIGRLPAAAQAGRERWTAAAATPPLIGRLSGASLVLHTVLLAATLLWASHFTPPEPVDTGSTVAMVFAPTEQPAPNPALPPAVPTERSAAPAPLDQPPPPPPQDMSAAAETAALSPPDPAVAAEKPLADAPAPSPEPVQAMTPQSPVKPAEPRHPTHAAPARIAKSSPAASAAASPAANPPAGPQLATAAPLIPPRPLGKGANNPAPLYPVIAARRHEQGRVVLYVDVTADGRPDSVRIASSSGSSALDHAAIDAVRLWQFIPATRGGTPVPATAEVPFTFTLSN